MITQTQRKTYSGKFEDICAATQQYANSKYQLIKGAGLLASGMPGEDVCLFLKSEDNLGPLVKYSAYRLSKERRELFRISPLFAVSGVGAVLDDSYLDLESIFKKGFEGRCMKPTFNAHLREIDERAESYLIAYGAPSKLKETGGDRYFLEINKFTMDNTKNIINPDPNPNDEKRVIEISAEEPQLMEKGLGILVRSAAPEDITGAIMLNPKLSAGDITKRINHYIEKLNGSNIRFIHKSRRF